jgi:hypothetical protein
MPGDIVLHLIDDSHVSGVSVVANQVDDQFEGLPGTPWEGPGFRVQLRDFVPLSPPLDRDDFFGVPKFADELLTLRKKYKNLFYNRDLELVQGSYLTPAPIEVVGLLNRAYINKTGKPLPYWQAPGAYSEDAITKGQLQPSYTIDDFAKDTWLEPSLIEQWRNRLQRKQHLVLQGPPGTGKTFIAGKLAKLANGFRRRAGR